MILIVGGTGTLGRDLIPRLLARGRSVRTLARHPATPANGERREEVEARIGDVRDAATRAMNWR